MIFFIVIGTIMAGLLWRKVFQMARETDLECARIRFNALRVQAAIDGSLGGEKYGV
jgi:hypothetical protein